jgi:carbamoyl-phosphate synthase large subunit
VAEDRERFQKLVASLKLKQPANASARSEDSAVVLAREVGFPLVVRPSYVLGGRAMEVVFNEDDLRQYMVDAVKVSNDSPVLLDRFLDLAIEVDVDAVSDGEDVLIGGIMEHIEQAGVHSGDTSCSLPPHGLAPETQDELRAQTRKLAKALNVVGLMNIQFAIQSGVIYILEVNPRASRTVPFVSKATGIALAKVAARVMTGKTLAMQFATLERIPPYFSVKEAVFPFNKFPEADPILGPEMKSTGEVMGVADNFGEAFAKAQLSAGQRLPLKGTVFFSVNDRDKTQLVDLARQYIELGFNIVATEGTANVLQRAGMIVERVYKVKEGRPNVVDLIKGERINLIVNTPHGQDTFFDEKAIRRAAVLQRIPTITTIAAARAAAEGIEALQEHQINVNPLQHLHAARAAAQ